MSAKASSNTLLLNLLGKVSRGGTQIANNDWSTEIVIATINHQISYNIIMALFTISCCTHARAITDIIDHGNLGCPSNGRGNQTFPRSIMLVITRLCSAITGLYYSSSLSSIFITRAEPLTVLHCMICIHALNSNNAKLLFGIVTHCHRLHWSVPNLHITLNWSNLIGQRWRTII